MSLSCRVLGHRYRFRVEGATMLWSCQRGCGAAGVKTYASEAAAARYARAFDDPDSAVAAHGFVPLSLLPLRAWHLLRHRLGKKSTG
jgi:hypothetical protein